MRKHILRRPQPVANTTARSSVLISRRQRRLQRLASLTNRRERRLRHGRASDSQLRVVALDHTYIQVPFRDGGRS